MAWHLVIRQPLATMADQCFDGDGHARLQDDAGGHEFSPLRIRYAEDRHLTYRGVVEDDGLDLAAIDVFAARHDHVLQPIQDVKVPICVLIADVSGTKEAVPKDRRRIVRIAVPEGRPRILRIVPVTSHDVCSTGHQLPALTDLYLLPRFVRDLHFDARTRSA